MGRTFDRRVVPDQVLEIIRRCQSVVPCHLGGGAALSGVHLAHRLSRDVDLACHRREDVRTLVTALPELARESSLLLDSGAFVRADLGIGTSLDITFEAGTDLEPSTIVDGIHVESLVDLRASKLTCILSRSEPRDLVDLYFLERAGYRPEDDLPNALKKDAGIDPGTLAWLLGRFPVEPLPIMLQPLSADDLRKYRDDLRERLRRLAVPGE